MGLLITMCDSARVALMMCAIDAVLLLFITLCVIFADRKD